MEDTMNKKKRNLLFISHSEKDSKIISDFVDLLYDIGLRTEDMFCSSRTEMDIAIGEDIYDYLRSVLDSDNVITLFMLSDNYYSSAACLNEMGAVWLKQSGYYTFLLPEFEYKDIRGAINPNVKGIKLDITNKRLKGDLTNFKKRIEQDFGIQAIDNNRWEKQRNQFIESIKNYSTEVKVNLANYRGYCIGENNFGECSVDYDKTASIVKTTFDFSKTNSQICSVVFFVGELNAFNKFQQNKCLSFKLKAENEFNVTVELRLKNQDVPYTITATKNWVDYSIPLKEFGGAADNWKVLKEIKFLTYRKDIDAESIYIKDITLT